MYKKGLCWIRRDIRLHDHHALSAAIANCDEVQLIFIFDSKILSKLPKNDRRVSFIHESLEFIENELNKKGASIIIRHGDPIEEIPMAMLKYKCDALFFNKDFEPYALKRDKKIKSLIKNAHEYLDHVYYEPKRILNGKGEVYKVFTPYKKKWLEELKNEDNQVALYKCALNQFSEVTNKHSLLKFDWMEEIGFEKTTNALQGGTKEAKKHLLKFEKKIQDYKEARDIPSIEGTSNLSPYIRHGCLSIRDMMRAALKSNSNGAQIWLSELIWREFYQMILFHFPHVEKSSFKKQYDAIKWKGTDEHFKLWCEGQTGFPIIDGAMRCLNQTGMMHNRLRMIVASFLCKTLLIDWRRGEEYFALKLLDFDLAANNGGWQWSSSTGCDAQPYFRIFNPYSQSQRFDGEGKFIKRYCPELKFFNSKYIHAPHETDILIQTEAQCLLGSDYPYPIVDYKTNRDQALKMYKEIK